MAGHPQVRDAAVLVHEDGATKRLVAYVVSREPVADGDLAAFLGERLPGYMVPGVFVPQDSLPLNPNGKVDRRALAAVEWEGCAAGEREHVAPRTAVEERLAGIWQDVLGTGAPVGVLDNFFSLGGDSILSLQVIFRAKQAGLYFTVKQLFQYQTIAELAPVVEEQDAPRVQAEQGLVTGPVELTPIQRWFFAHGFAQPDHFNQSVLVEVAGGLSGEQWGRVVGRLLEQHDGLRTRFFRQGGEWRAELAGLPETLPLRVVDLSSGPVAERQERLLEIAQQTQSGMDLTTAPLFRAVLFTGMQDQNSFGSQDQNSSAPKNRMSSGPEDQKFAGPENHEFSGPGDGGHRLLLVAHHLVVDVVSWRVVLEDLEVLAEQVRQGRELVLPAKSSSWQSWAARLGREAGSVATSGEVSYWREQVVPVRALPLDGAGGDNAVGRSRVVEAVLGAEEVRALLQDVPAAFRTRVNDVLLTAVASAVGAWTGDGHVRVDLEGHGREELFGDVDVSRTAGWFTTVSPLRLPVPAEGCLGEGLKRVKELLRERPRQGIGFGLLAHGPVETELTGAAPAQVSFNYLGQFDGSFGGSFAASSGKAGPDWGPGNQRPYLIDIVSRVQDGRLHMEWTYSETAHEEATVRRVAERTLEVLRELIEAVKAPDAVGYSPSDLPLSGLTQTQINDLVGQLRELPQWRASKQIRPLEDCYPQTPIQQGLWFQSQFAQGEGVYHVQHGPADRPGPGCGRLPAELVTRHAAPPDHAHQLPGGGREPGPPAGLGRSASAAPGGGLACGDGRATARASGELSPAGPRPGLRPR